MKFSSCKGHTESCLIVGYNLYYSIRANSYVDPNVPPKRKFLRVQSSCINSTKSNRTIIYNLYQDTRIDMQEVGVISWPYSSNATLLEGAQVVKTSIRHRFGTAEWILSRLERESYLPIFVKYSSKFKNQFSNRSSIRKF